MLCSFLISSLAFVTAFTGATTSAHSPAEVGVVRRAEANKLSARQFGGFGGSAFGGVNSGSSSMSTSQTTTTSSSSISTVMGGYTNLLQEITSIQSMISGGGIGAAVAMQQLQQLAVQFQQTFSTFQSCNCFGGGAINPMTSVFAQVFTQFQSLMSTVQQVFPGQLGGMFGNTFGGLTSTLNNFFSIVHSSGISLGQIVPRGFGQFISQAGMSSTSSFLQNSLGCSVC